MTRSAATGSDREELVVLVNPADTFLGVAPKLEAHRRGHLHRAVSVVLFDDQGRLLLQRRADEKYHSGGLWSNSACGHPRPGESVANAARRRLDAELGIRECDVTRVDQFLYFADLGGGLVEHELDHVVVGRWNGAPEPNPREVSETQWVGRDDLLADIVREPARYTAWLRSVLYHAFPVPEPPLRRPARPDVSTCEHM